MWLTKEVMACTDESLKSSSPPANCDGNSPLHSSNSTSGYSSASKTSFKSLPDDIEEKCVDLSLITFNDNDELPGNFKSLLSKPIVSTKNSRPLKRRLSQKSVTVDDSNAPKRRRVKFFLERSKSVRA